MIRINYFLENAGWASGAIGNRTKTKFFDISYLHDSLKNLADSVIQVHYGGEAIVIFMQEPGEHQLVLKKVDSNKINYELRAYRDWASWDMIPQNEFELILTGETSLLEYARNVQAVLAQILHKFGVELYKEKWIENEFPMNEYLELKKYIS